MHTDSKEFQELSVDVIQGVDQKDGTYVFSIPMLATFANVGQFSATFQVACRGRTSLLCTTQKIKSEVIIPDPRLTSFSYALPIRVLAQDCSSNPLMTSATDGRSCAKRTCPQPPNVTFARRMDPPRFDVLSSVTYICEPGFLIKGTSENTQICQCSEKGIWVNPPVCQPNAAYACQAGTYAIKSCGDTGMSVCTAAKPCQLKPEFKAATGGRDLALWSWFCSEDGVAQCQDGSDEWLMLSNDGQESSCPVILTDASMMLAALAVICIVSFGATTFVKSSIAALGTADGAVVRTGYGSLLGGGLGFVDIISDYIYLIDLAGQRRLTAEFWISCTSLVTSMLVNTVASILTLKKMAEDKDAKSWLQDSKNRNWAALTVLFSSSRVESLELLAYAKMGFPMRKRWLEHISYIGILTPVLEDVVQCYVVITASTKLNEWTTMALVRVIVIACP